MPATVQLLVCIAHENYVLNDTALAHLKLCAMHTFFFNGVVIIHSLVFPPITCMYQIRLEGKAHGLCLQTQVYIYRNHLQSIFYNIIVYDIISHDMERKTKTTTNKQKENDSYY